MDKHDVVVLVDNEHSSLKLRGRSGFVPKGTVGVVLATRKHEEDPEECLLVKWRGVGTPRHTQVSWVERREQ